MAANSKWTAEEDSILTGAVLASGSSICWNTVAERLPGRSNKSCRKRWVHSLDPSLRKGRWTTPEDALLIMAVRRHGRHWYKVAELLPGRTDDQCAKRWKEKLDPSIRRDPWTEVEDLKLLEVLAKHGKRWNIISGTIKGRPAVQCRNRFLSLQRAGKVSEDGKSSTSTVAGRNPTSDTKTIIIKARNNEPSNHAAIDIDGQPGSPTSSALLAGSSSLSSPCPSSPSSQPFAEPLPPTWDSVSVAPSPPLVSTEGFESARIPTAFPMSLGFVDTEFFNDQNLGIAPNLNPLSSSSITSSSGILSEPFKFDDHEHAGAPLAFHGLGSAEQPFSWENLIMPTDGTLTPPQTIQDPLMFLVQKFMQRSNTHSPVVFPPESNSLFTMTCPLPLCPYQSSELISIWRHITWEHLGRTNKCSNAMAALVEKVVLGGEEK